MAKHMGRPPYRGDGFAVTKAARVAGLKYPTLNHWIRTGLIRPSVKPAGQGRGTTRVLAWKEQVWQTIQVDMDLHKWGGSSWRHCKCRCLAVEGKLPIVCA